MATRGIETIGTEMATSRAAKYCWLVVAAVLAIAMGVGLNAAIFTGGLQNFIINGPALARADLESRAQTDINKEACLRASPANSGDAERAAEWQAGVLRRPPVVTDGRGSRLKTAWNRSNLEAAGSKPCSSVTRDFIRSLLFHLATEATVEKAKESISRLFLAMTLAQGRGKPDCFGE